MNTHTGIKTENFLREVLFEEVLTRCLERAATDFSDHNVATLRKHGKKQRREVTKRKRDGADQNPKRQILCKTRTLNSSPNRCLISGLISFRASHLISGH